MGSYAEAFGYTPEQFYQLTLPQIAAFGRYIEERDKEIDSAKSSSSRKSKAEKPVSSIENLVAVFGDDETKRKLLSDG
jgi:hypothetical protein